MSQASVVVANGTGAAVRSALNSALAALVSNNSGTSAPSTTYPFMLWADTTNDLLKMRNEADSAWITIGRTDLTNPGLSAVPRWHIAGMTYGNNGTDPTNDIDIAAGQCASDDVTDANRVLLNPGVMTKQLDAVWAAGTAAGGRISSESLANGGWNIFAFRRSGGSDDYCFSQSLSPTLPDGGTNKRLIGWINRVSGAIATFTTYETTGGGLELLWNAPTLDIDLSNTLTTSRRTDAVNVPLSFSTIAKLNMRIQDSTTNWECNFCCPDQTDAAPSPTVAPLGNIVAEAVGNLQQMDIRTSSTGTIAARANGTVDSYRVVTVGFTWVRRN